MPKPSPAICLLLALGCTKAGRPETAPASALRDPPAAAAASPAAPAPARPPPPPLPAPTTVEVAMEPICPGGYSGRYRNFLEDARRPIATVVLGHYEYSDMRDCYMDKPVKILLTVEIPRTSFYPKDTLTAKVLGGDALRPLFDEECTRVIACDDLNGDGACDVPAEPMLNGLNDRSRYVHASVSRPARFRLTMMSRDDRSCPGTNYYSRCCPEGHSHHQDSRTCYRLGSNTSVPARCP